MTYWIYIIYSKAKDKYYVGQTKDVSNRLSEHIKNKNLEATDWELKYTEEFPDRSGAVKRETEIKSKERRSYIEWLINLHKST
jgi:putative endonuclease